jgi:hypothetical protein
MTTTVALHCPWPGCGERAGRIEADDGGWLRLVRHERGGLDDRPGRARLVTRDRVDRYADPRRHRGFRVSMDGDTWRCPRCARRVTVDEASVVAELGRARPARTARLVLVRTGSPR